MAAIVSNEGELKLNNMIKNSAANTATPGTFKLMLYIDSMFTPSATMVYADVSGNEATFTGYARATVTFGAASTVSGWAVSDGGTVTFTRSSTGAGQTVYGWMLIFDEGGGTITSIAAENLATSRTFTNAGDTESFAVKFRSNSAN